MRPLLNNLKLKNKKGSAWPIIVFFLILFTIVIFGFIFSIGAAITDYAADTIVPEIRSIGNVSGTNVSQNADYVVVPVNTVVQQIPWIIGLVYVIALIFSIVFVVSSRIAPHPAFLGFYVAFIILMILGCIIMSNMYQDIYSGTDEIATRLQEQTLMSYMILFSPVIITFIAFFAGVIAFTRGGQDPLL